MYNFRRLRLLRPQLKTSQRLMWNPQKLPSSRMFVVVALTLTSCHVPTSLGQEAPTYAERLDELSHVLSHAQSGKTYRLGDLLEAVHAKHLLEMTPVAVQQAVMEAAGTLSRNGEGFSAAVSGTDVGEVSQPANVSALCLNHTIATMFGLLLRKEWALQIQSYLNVTMPVFATCPRPKTELDGKAAAAIVILSIMLTLMVVGTVLDILFVQRPLWHVEEVPQLLTNEAADDEERRPLVQHEMTREVKLPENANAVPYYGDLIKRWTFQGVANAVLSVDTFFAIRLTPAYMLILMVYVCLTPYWGEGPLWPQTIPDRDNCLTSWWANFLYINNLVKSTTSDICMVQTWYLANDMQFHILSPLIFVPLYFNKFAGLAVSGVFILITAIVPGVLTTTHHYPPSILPDTLDSNDTNLADALNNFYSKPYNRMGPYVIGMLAGYFLYHTDCRLKINKIVNLSIWAVATGSAMGVVYGLYDAYNGHPITLSVAAFYNAVNRQVWALCVSWVVVACVTGNGGFVNTILSWRALIPLSRLTYCVYLMHIMMMELYLYNSAIPFYMSDLTVLCVNHTVATLLALFERQSWALQMLDAMGKPSPAILDGNFNWPGAYDYCHKVRSSNTLPQFSGQYCTGQVLLSVSGPFGPGIPTPISLGLCVPDTCSAMDVTLLLNEAKTALNISLPVYATCTKPEKELDAKAVVAIVICSIILMLMVVGTVLDVLLIQRPKWQVEETTHLLTNGLMDPDERQPLLSGKLDPKVSSPENGVAMKVFLSFSVYTNGAKLLSTKQASGSLSCIHGIRFLSMTWVVLGHAFLFPLFSAENTGPYLMALMKRWTFQAIGNALVSVDTFFVLSGLLVAYLSLKEMKKREGKLNWFLFYFHRFWRLTPAYMLIIMVYVCISPYWGEGPLWPETLPDRDNCKTSWWTNLLYINNFVYSADTEMCLAQSWYLANDMQFYILSPLIFVPFYFSTVLGLVSSGIFLLITAIVPGVITMRDHIAPTILPSTLAGNETNMQDWMSVFYDKPYNRMGPYIIGMLAGYFLYRTECRLRINKIVNLCMWAVATGSALAVVYGLYDAYNGHPVTLSVAAFYNAVNRQVWAFSVSWVVIACVTGNGGFVNTILSWPALIPLSRLTYCIYLLHIMMMELYLYNADRPFYMNDLNVVSNRPWKEGAGKIVFFLAILVLSYMAAVIASLAFEAPMMALEKVILQSRSKKEKEQRP
ncbi:hypothetical protein BaRGS_00013019 [Batillaria attramentaria]|uniref:Nose resistant-to-fluoxetine protein N-terminal domain-containing protein n=1 Tax=Batillaria attramentaria TaxID=370345 RepID=A0ABD0L8Q8_9CAEN